MSEKATYVRRSRQSRNHECHWPGCTAQVPPAMWGCKRHWFQLPKRLRDRIWDTYEIGQEESLTPSAEYLVVAREVQDWITARVSGEANNGGAGEAYRPVSPHTVNVEANDGE